MNMPLTMLALMSIFMMLLTLVTRQKHMLMALLALEGLMLMTLILISLLLKNSNIHLNMLCVLLLTFGACEASLGLSVLVTMSRMMGSDLMKSLSMNKC